MEKVRRHTTTSRPSGNRPDGGKTARKRSIRNCTSVSAQASFVGRTRNDFLKQTFVPVKAYEVGRGLKIPSEYKDMDRSAAADYLYRSVKCYFELLGKELKFVPSGSLDKDCYTLYFLLKETLPDHTEGYFDFCDGKFSVVLQAGYEDFPSCLLFYLPIGGVEKMSPVLVPLFMEFVSFYMDSQGISYPANHYDFSYILEDEFFDEEEERCVDDSGDEERVPGENYEFHKLLMRYREGDIHSWFCKIMETPYCIKELKRKLVSLDGLKMDEANLVQVMLDGLDLLCRDRILNYGRETIQDNELYFPRLFTICWHNDGVVEYATDCLNTDMQELVDLGPTQFFYLTPDMQTIPEKSTYPLEFADWYRRLFEILERYE